MQTKDTMGRTRSIACGVLLAVAVLLMISGVATGYRPHSQERYSSSGQNVEVTPVEAPRGSGIKVNTADAETLAELPGIGEKLAQAIIDEREANGPFYYPEDLTAASGIGDKKLEAIRGLIDLDTEDP